MKITINLPTEYVKGIRNYFIDTDGDKPSAKDIKYYIEGIVFGILEAPQEAVSDYINIEKQKLGD